MTGQEYYGVQQYFFTLIGEDGIQNWDTLTSEEQKIWNQRGKESRPQPTLAKRLKGWFHFYSKHLDYQKQALIEGDAPQEVVKNWTHKFDRFWEADKEFHKTFFPQQ